MNNWRQELISAEIKNIAKEFPAMRRRNSRIGQVLEFGSGLLTIFESPIIHSVAPQILHKLLSSNALGKMQYSQEHFKTMVYTKLGGQTGFIMGDSTIENEIPSELSRENMTSSHASSHTWKEHVIFTCSQDHRCYGYIINRASQSKKLFEWNGLVFHCCLYSK